MFSDPTADYNSSRGLMRAEELNQAQGQAGLTAGGPMPSKFAGASALLPVKFSAFGR